MKRSAEEAGAADTGAEEPPKRHDKEWMSAFPSGTVAPRIGADFQAEIPAFVPQAKSAAAGAASKTAIVVDRAAAKVATGADGSASVPASK
jgi:hypothetical protein